MTPGDTTEIDLAIELALDRLDARMRDRGASFAALSRSIRSAAAGGKRLRPRLVVAAHRALDGCADDPARQVAAAFELLHTAFVIHDDVIDGDTVRRGTPNIAGEFAERAGAEGAGAVDAAAFGTAAAILAGDLLLHEAQRLLALVEVQPAVRARVLDVFDDAVLVSAAGELADVEQDLLSAAPALEEALATSRDKTAVYSFSAPLRAGAALAGADEETDAALSRAGIHLGIAFQLVDDLIGAFGTAAQAGRAVGSDLVAAKRTPLIALAGETDAWPEVNGALALARTGPIALRSAQRALDDSGARVRGERLVTHLLERARMEAATLPSALAALVDELADAVQGRVP